MALLGLRRARAVDLTAFDASTGRWTVVPTVPAPSGARLDHIALSTYNVWYDDHFAAQRFQAIADLLAARGPDVMAFQEVTDDALALFLDQPWIRESYACAAVVGDGVGNYGMLLLSRLPISRVSYARLPSRTGRGVLRATLAVNGGADVCSVHLESGRKSSWRRAWQLRAMFRALRGTENVLLLGDFNMRDEENGRVGSPYLDVWPALRPDDDGFTADEQLNLMRHDAKNKKRRLRFDRVLVKGVAWTPTAIDLLGTEPLSKDSPRLFPSDHFGVYCRVRCGG